MSGPWIPNSVDNFNYSVSLCVGKLGSIDGSGLVSNLATGIFIAFCLAQFVPVSFKGEYPVWSFGMSQKAFLVGISSSGFLSVFEMYEWCVLPW